MTDCSLFNGINLFDHVGAWRCAIFATDIGLQLQPTRASTVDALYEALSTGSTERDAWQKVLGTHMPVVVEAHLMLRRRKPKQVAKMLASWFENYQALRAKPFTTYNTLAQRLQALAITAPPELVEQVQCHARSSAEQVQQVLLTEHQIDLPLSAAITCLLVLTTALKQGPVVPPATCGSLTPMPASWANVPVIKQVETESGLPRVSSGLPYAILCYTAATAEATIRVVCEHGEDNRFTIHLPSADQPVWLSHVTSAPSPVQQLVVGCRRHVGLVSSDAATISWTPRDILPVSNHCEKLNQYVVWQQAGKLLAIHLHNTCLLEDEEEVHQLCVQQHHAGGGVAACQNVVYANGQALFMLPPEFEQKIAAVHRVTRDTVDVFTAVGDWWRVHVPTLSAHVVGLDIYPSSIVDVCLYC